MGHLHLQQELCLQQQIEEQKQEHSMPKQLQQIALFYCTRFILPKRDLVIPARLRLDEFLAGGHTLNLAKF